MNWIWNLISKKTGIEANINKIMYWKGLLDAFNKLSVNCKLKDEKMICPVVQDICEFKNCPYLEHVFIG